MAGMTGDALHRHLAARLAEAGDASFVVAFSGGPDSTALLHALAHLPEAHERGLRALHVDHGLHVDSERWARHCTTFCASLDVPCATLRVVVSHDAGLGLEAAAREARYGALSDALRDGERLLTAHHLDDQAETFLLRALRGAGPDGLRAMRPLRRLGHGWLWRPLLDLPRAALSDYVAAHGLACIDDPANRDLRHDRSWLREAMMPLLRSRWPQAAAGLARGAALCAEAAELLDGEDAALLAQAQGIDPRTLDVTALTAVQRPRRARLLRGWVGRLGLPPLPGHAIEAIERTLLVARADAESEFAWAGAVIRRWRGLLHAGIARPALPSDFEATWNGRAPLHLPTGDVLGIERFESDAPMWPDDSIVRARRGGERIVLPGRAHSHALKHVLQDLGVPPWERERLPLLFDPDGELLAAGDAVISSRMQARLTARRARLRLTRTV